MTHLSHLYSIYSSNLPESPSAKSSPLLDFLTSQPDPIYRAKDGTYVTRAVGRFVLSTYAVSVTVISLAVTRASGGRSLFMGQLHKVRLGALASLIISALISP
jgi:hypothetical protein